MITVCFRCDDPSAISDHDLERRILEIFARYQVPLCVAPIPFRLSADRTTVPLSPQNMRHLIDAQRNGLVDIALHGHTHIHRGDDRTGLSSEFSGLSYVQQSKLIDEGLAHLQRVFPGTVDGFVPPWNSYDRSTARAAFQAGIRYLSAGWNLIGYKQLGIVPRTCSMKNARQALESALTIGEFDPVVVVVFHPDEFEEYRDPPIAEPPPFTSLQALESLLCWIKNDTPAVVSSIREVAVSLSNTRPLWTPHHLPLPYRFKSVVSNNVLLRSPKISTVARIFARKLKRVA